jgi:hypothetical protein
MLGGRSDVCRRRGRPGWETVNVTSVDEFLANVEQRRSATGASIDPKARAAHGQFFTPRASAALVASLEYGMQPRRRPAEASSREA